MSPGTNEPTGARVPGDERTRKRVFLIAPLTPAWAATIRTLQEPCEQAEFDLVVPPVTPAELGARLAHGESDATVAIVDLCGDPIRGMSTVAACRHTAPSVPVVVVAANPTQELVLRIRLAGVFYLALDPVDVDEMRDVLQSAFGCVARRRSRSSTCRDRRRVLIIDDDADFLASTTALLETQGYCVSTAASGRDGLARMTENVPDLIVLDIMMENDWAGYEVNQRVKFGTGFECIRHVPILMVSSIPIDPATRFSRAGEVDMITPDAYLMKPLDIPTFLARVRALLGQSEPEVVF
jgi:DNA-binding response OmpR family regulator